MAGDEDGSGAGRRAGVCQCSMFMTGEGDGFFKRRGGGKGREALRVCDFKMTGPLQPAETRMLDPCCNFLKDGETTSWMWIWKILIRFVKFNS